ncbi:hypothetical protein IRJ41_022630%2C partial [Scomber scombrus]|uniref:RING-type domain-containing protein n=1 Tax=Scomber scombrus TaxID=13677 RepID=A0AAV1PNW4_SCOSC
MVVIDMEAVEDLLHAQETDASASVLTHSLSRTDDAFDLRPRGYSDVYIEDENTSSASNIPATSSLTAQWTASAPTRSCEDEETPAIRELTNPAGLVTPSQLHTIKQGFCCVVCMMFIKEPVFTACCRSIIGCKTCIKQWRETSEHCPKCRGDTAGHDIFEVTGLSEALSALSALFEED